MRKCYLMGFIFVSVALVLAACSSSNSPSGTTSPYAGPTSSSGANGNLPGTGLTNTVTSTVATQPITSTTAVTSTTPATSTNTVTSTTPMTSTNPVTSTGTSTQTMPSSGATSSSLDPGLISNEMKFTVMDQQNNPLGQVQDMILDLAKLKVAYVIVARSASSGTTSSQPVAIPWDRLQLQTTSAQMAPAGGTPAAPGQPNASAGNTGQGEFVFKGDTKQLANAPAFDPSILPQFGISTGGWDASIVSYWNQGGSSSSTSPTGTPSSSAGSGMLKLQGIFLASKVIGFSISDTNGQPLARISDAVVDVNSGAITFVILTVKDKLTPVPVGDLGIDLANQSVVLQSGAQALQNAPSFIMGNLPLTTSSDWDSQIKSFWQSQVQPTSTP